VNTPIIELDAAALRDHVAAEPSRTRVRSETLIDAMDDTELIRQYSSIMFPPGLRLAHIGNQEELWLMRDVGSRDPVRAESTTSTTRSNSPDPTLRHGVTSSGRFLSLPALTRVEDPNQ